MSIAHTRVCNIYNIHTYSIVLIVLSLLQEESQALQAVTMLDIFIKIHVEYIKLEKLARCDVITKNSTRMSDLLRKILKLKNALVNYCCYNCAYIVTVHIDLYGNCTYMV